LTAERPNPTDAELAILKVLWDRGPSAVHDVRERMGGAAATGYTTVLKLLQIMHDKGLVERRAEGRRHVYSAAIPRALTERRLIDRLMTQAFDGSAARLVQGALAAKPASATELAEIRRMLDDFEREAK
jgi:predicted transcriptional regulator